VVATTSPLPWSPVFELLLLLVGVTNPQNLQSDQAKDALIAGIAASLGIANFDKARITLTNVWTVVSSSRRLQDSAQVGVVGVISNPNGDVNPAGLASVRPFMANHINDALGAAGVDSQVTNVAETPPPAAPCDAFSYVPNVNLNAIDAGETKGMATLQRMVNPIGTYLLVALSFGLGCTVLAGGFRYVQRRRSPICASDASHQHIAVSSDTEQGGADEYDALMQVDHTDVGF